MKAVKTKYGHTMFVDPDDHIGKKIISQGIYDRRGLAFATSILQAISARNVLDVGANIGNHALVYSLFSGHVWCFEPNPAAYDMLVRNIADNDIGNVRANHFGLSDQDKEGTLYVDESGNLGASTLRQASTVTDRTYSQTTVSLRIGDVWAKENEIGKIDFIKLDVEGHEQFAIRGLAETIKNNRPIVMMEWSKESSDREAITHSGLFQEVFADYSVHGLFLNTDRTYWRTKSLGRLRRLWQKVKGRQVWCTPFSPETKLDITDLLLVPNECKLRLKCVEEPR